MVKQIISSICIVAVLFSSFPTQTFAGSISQPEAIVQISNYIPIMPFWSHTSSIAVLLNIDNNGRAVMTGSVIGQPGTTSISVNALLERVNPNGTTTHIGSWNNIQVNGGLWVWERVHHVARGHNYRLTLTSTVYRNGGSETISLSRTTFAL